MYFVKVNLDGNAYLHMFDFTKGGFENAELNVGSGQRGILAKRICSPAAARGLSCQFMGVPDYQVLLCTTDLKIAGNSVGLVIWFSGIKTCASCFICFNNVSEGRCSEGVPVSCAWRQQV